MTLILYYLTCMYKLFYLLVWLIVTVSYALFRFCIVILVFVGRLFCPFSLACCVVWSGGISSVCPVVELSYFFYLLLCRCRCLFFLFPVVRCMFHISLVFRCIGLSLFFTVYNNIH